MNIGFEDNWEKYFLDACISSKRYFDFCYDKVSHPLNLQVKVLPLYIFGVGLKRYQ